MICPVATTNELINIRVPWRHVLHTRVGSRLPGWAGLVGSSTLEHLHASFFIAADHQATLLIRPQRLDVELGNGIGFLDDVLSWFLFSQDALL